MSVQLWDYKGLTIWILGKWQFVPVEVYVMCYLPI